MVADIKERGKENKKMSILSAIALATMVFARITMWDGRPSIDHALIIAMIVLLSCFQIYLAWERHSIRQKERQNE